MNILIKSIQECRTTCTPEVLRSIFKLIVIQNHYQISNEVVNAFNNANKHVTWPNQWRRPVRNSFITTYMDNGLNVHLYALRWYPGGTTVWHYHPSNMYRSCIGMNGKLHELVVNDKPVTCVQHNVYEYSRPPKIIEINKNAWHMFSNIEPMNAYTLHLLIKKYSCNSCNSCK